MMAYHISAMALTRLRTASTGTLFGAVIAALSIMLPHPVLAKPRTPVSIRALTGTWRVVAVRVAPSPVQALSPDDPSYMGAILDVAPARIAWRQPHRVPSLSYACEWPRLKAAVVSCSNGEFGPPNARMARMGKRLSLDWFDGGTLILERRR